MRFISKLAFSAAAFGAAVTPAAAANTSLTNLTESQNFTAVQSTIKHTRLSNTSATGMGNYARATSQVKYDHATGSYTIRDTGNLAITSTFGPANVTSSSAAFTNYSKGPSETLRLYKPGNATQGVTLSYTGFGQWRRLGAPAYGPGTSVNDTYFVYGIKTPAASIPTSGTASYVTALDGTFANKDGAYAVTGNGTFSANFGAGTIGYSATANGARESDSAALAFGTMSGTGTIGRASSSFKGTGSVNGSGYRMDVNGYFFGPSYQEVGGVFRLTGNGGNGQGAMVGQD